MTSIITRTHLEVDRGAEDHIDGKENNHEKPSLEVDPGWAWIDRAFGRVNVLAFDHRAA